MLKKQFILSVIFSSIGMFLLSYFWHGYVLLDFVTNGTPSGLILFYKIVEYLVISSVITWVIRTSFLNKWLKYFPMIKAIIVGVLIGILVFAGSTFKGISFNVTLNHKYLLLNFFWQIFEQAMGGVIVALVHNLVYDPEMVNEEDNN